MMFRTLQYIDAVYKERSFSRAAQKLHLAQPSLSLTIKKFEQEVGIQIFDRSVTPIQLTEPGAVYLRGIQEILSIQNDLESYIDDYKELKTGKLTLGAAHFFASHLLPSLIARFLEKYPHVEIRLVEGDFNSLLQMLLDGKIDLFLDSDNFEHDLIECFPLFCERILLAVPDSDPINRTLSKYRLSIDDIKQDRHLLETHPPVPLSRFQNYKFLMLERGHDMRARVRHICSDSGFEVQVGMELNQLMTVFNMVDYQLGASFVSDTIAKLTNTGAKVSFYRLAHPQAVRYINGAYKRNRYLSRSMNAFMGVMTEIGPEGLTAISGG